MFPDGLSKLKQPIPGASFPVERDDMNDNL
jgi:hypothetical protein